MNRKSMEVRIPEVKNIVIHLLISASWKLLSSPVFHILHPSHATGGRRPQAASLRESLTEPPVGMITTLSHETKEGNSRKVIHPPSSYLSPLSVVHRSYAVSLTDRVPGERHEERGERRTI